MGDLEKLISVVLFLFLTIVIPLYVRDVWNQYKNDKFAKNIVRMFGLEDLAKKGMKIVSDTGLPKEEAQNMSKALTDERVRKMLEKSKRKRRPRKEERHERRKKET